MCVWFFYVFFFVFRIEFFLFYFGKVFIVEDGGWVVKKRVVGVEK